MRRCSPAALAAVVALFSTVRAVAAVNLVREDFHVRTQAGVGIFVRELRREGGSTPGSEPLILVHGARAPGLASFDLPVPGGSLAADLLERTGRRIYIMDARGYGASDRSAAMSQPASANPPQVRAYQAVRDIAAVAAEAERRSGSRTVALFGWATGGMWAAYYASLSPEQVGHLITLNALYGGSYGHAVLGPGSPESDPTHPDRLNPRDGAYSLNSALSLMRPWDQSIPTDNKAAWRDPAVATAYQREALASDPSSNTHDPPALRAPLGAIEDSFYQASGRRLFDASSISAHVLIVRSERDFWSRPEDVQAFAHDAVHAASITTLSLPEATHFVHLERSQHGRDELLNAIAAFLADSDVPE